MDRGDPAGGGFPILFFGWRQQQNTSHRYDEEHGLFSGTRLKSALYGGVWQRTGWFLFETKSPSLGGEGDHFRKVLGAPVHTGKTTSHYLCTIKRRVPDDRVVRETRWQLIHTIGARQL